MSATFRVLKGRANIRINGVTADVAAPWEERGIEFNPAAPKDATVASKIESEMRSDLYAPAMGAADILPSQGTTGQQVYGLVEIEAEDGPIEFTHYADIQSAHPDEVFGQAKPQTDITLQPGEKLTVEVSHQNAWTFVLNRA
jgi:hypothetical protein